MTVRKVVVFALICFLQISLSLAKAYDSPENEDKCKKYATFRQEEGYLSNADVKDYCRIGCDTLPRYSCPETGDDAAFNLSRDFGKRLEELFRASETLDDNWLVEPFDADSMSESVAFFAPWMYGLLYVLVGAQMMHGNRPHKRPPMVLVNIIILLSYFVFFRDREVWPMIFNILLACQSSFASSSHHIFNDVAAVAIMIVSLILGTLMINDLIGQLVLGIVLFAGFIVLLYRKITNSRKEDLFNMISLLLTGKMCSDYTVLIFDRLMVENPGTLLIRHCINAMLPWEGRYVSVLNNMNYSSAQLAALFVKADEIESGHLYIFFVGLMTYALVFLGIRAGVGLIMLRKMHADFSLQLIWTGFYSYAIDVVNPFKIVLVSLLKKDSRMLWYALIMCAFNVGEFFTARDFFVIRCILSVLDYLVIESGLSGAHRFLEFDVDLGGMVFEKPGAFPYFFLDNLMDVRRHCKRIITSTHDNAGALVSESAGVGLVRQTKTGPKLLTVQHCLRSKDFIRTEDDGIREPIGHIDVIGDSVDPPVSLNIPGCRLDGSTMRDISSSELKSVKYLFVVSPCGATCPINDWSISNGDIHATVNLRSGDSGSPVCAVLDSGVCVLAGVVSRGDSREGSRNLISAIKEARFIRGSPGIQNNYFDASEHLLDGQVYKATIEAAFECRELAAKYAEDFPEYFDVDFERQPEDVPKWQYNPDNNDGDDEQAARQRVKGKMKNWKKNRAVKKRAYLRMLKALDLDGQSFEAMRQFGEGGPIVKFNVLRKQARRIAYSNT